MKERGRELKRLYFRHTYRKEPRSMGEYIPPHEGIVPASTSKLLNESNVLPKTLCPEIKSTLIGSIFTLTNTILGSGTLAVPYAISCSGWFLGPLVLVTLACITQYSVSLLLQASDMAGEKCAKTYESLGHYTMGKYGTWLAEFTFIFGGFGTLVSYFIFISNLFCVALDIPSSYNSLVMVLCTVLVIMPLSFSRRIGKLQITSLLATFSVAYVVLFAVVAFFVFQKGHYDGLPRDTIKAIQLDSNSIYTVTLLMAAFACHNTTLPVYEELEERSLKRMQKATGSAIGIAFTLYTFIGLAGYASFTTATMDNVLLNYNKDLLVIYPNISGFLRAGRICMASALLLTVPIALWPFRSCLCSVYLRITHGQQLPSSATSYGEYMTITLLAESMILFCALLVPSVKVPLSIVGSVSGSLIIFILPSLFYILQGPEPVLSRVHTGPLILLGTGVIIGIVGFSLTMHKLIYD